MNFKKTWFGYLNFVISSIITGAAVIALVFFLMFKTNITNMSQNNPLSVTNPMFWAFLGISIALIGIVFLLVFIIKKIRKKALKNVYYIDQKPRRITGLILGLAVFSSGLFLKIRFILNHEFEPAFDTDAARAMFNGEIRFTGFNSFELLYARLIAYIYRYVGIKPELFVWFNLFLSCALYIVIFILLKNIFDEFTACFPLAFLSFSPASFSKIAIGSIDYLKFLIVCVLLLLAVKLLSISKEVASFPIFGLVLMHLFIITFLFVVPIMSSKSMSVAFSFDTGKERMLFSIFDNIYVFAGVLICLLIAEFNFLFSENDRLSPISFIWLIALLFFLFTDNSFFHTSWPDVPLMKALFATFAGLGLSGLIFGDRCSSEFAEDFYDELESREFEKQAENTRWISRSESARLLTSETTKVKETLEENISAETAKDENVTQTAVKEEPSREETSKEEPAKEAENADDRFKNVVLFENPLPLPKPHVKKEINYNIEPDAENMKFDIDIKENDDFDI